MHVNPRYLAFTLYLSTLLCSSCQLSLPTDATYNAGVVEMAPITTGTSKERVELSKQAFLDMLDSPEISDLDIILFPEHILNNRDMATYVPHPAQNVTPCNTPDYDVFLVELSCAARSRAVYVVINVVEKVRCTNNSLADTLYPCRDNGLIYYNTNVVFDRQGRVISRYRKTHLWRYEYYSTAVLKQPDMSSFATDFGVTFGHFICFDMLFYEPAQRLIRELNITDILYPTYWFSELPFLTALQLQEGWAFANNVNLLAADGSDPAGRTTGSGIYAGRAGRLVAEIYEQPTNKLLKATVPKRQTGTVPYLPPQVVPVFRPQLVTPRFTQLATYRDYNLDIFSTLLLPANELNQLQRLCHEPSGFCCEFDIQRVSIGLSANYAAYRYRLGVYFGNDTTHIRVDSSALAVCALFACTGTELYSCGRIFPAQLNVANQHYFSSITISGEFPAAKRRLIMPSTVDAMMLPLSVAQYSWEESSAVNGTLVRLQLTAPKADILTFGIWGNYYTEQLNTHNLDYMQPVPPPAALNTSSSGAGAAVGLKLLLLPLLTLALARR